jgi:hypothetical protein
MFLMLPKHSVLLRVTLSRKLSVRPNPLWKPCMHASDVDCGIRHMPKSRMIRICCSRPYQATSRARSLSGREVCSGAVVYMAK